MPLVAIRERKPEREKEMELQPPTRGIIEALTGWLEFPEKSGGESGAVVVIEDPTYDDGLSINGGSVPLAGDFTAPLALSFGGINDLLLGIRNMLNVSAGQEVAGVYLTESFDPNRIPVLLIHGFSSSPIVWRNVVSEAMRDPEIRKNYQFWYAFYATGAPVMQSAAMIRDDIEAIRKRHDPGGKSRASQRMVVVGYSMGGTIAQILTTDIGNRFWDEIATVPFDEVNLDSADRLALGEWLFWKPLPGLDRVIFIATPHKGTKMADASFAQWGRRLIRLPGGIIDLQMRFYKALAGVLRGDVPVFDKITGIDGLSASSPIYPALDGAPFARGLHIHSIIGDRGPRRFAGQQRRSGGLLEQPSSRRRIRNHCSHRA